MIFRADYPSAPWANVVIRANGPEAALTEAISVGLRYMEPARACEACVVELETTGPTEVLIENWA